MSDSSKKLPYGYLALDVESTGRDFVNDTCFAIGYAHGTPETLQRSGKIVLDLGLPIDNSDLQTQWSKYWNKCGYDRKCFDEFWGQPDNLMILDTLQRESDCKESSDFARKLNAVLQQVEKTYERYALIFDTVAYDSVWLNMILSKDGYEPLLYHRNGEYHVDSSFDIDSYIRGLAMSFPHNDNKVGVDVLMDGFTAKRGDHDPQIDAENILSKFQFVIKKINAN